MKFLVDVCRGFQVAEFLKSKGIDVLEAYKIEPHLSDVNILKLAVSEKSEVKKELFNGCLYSDCNLQKCTCLSG